MAVLVVEIATPLGVTANNVTEYVPDGSPARIRYAVAVAPAAGVMVAVV